ncbi:hypothetical protein Misp01_33730 [Microtetraspora sp. NBRC 13810]|nr:hypothetical protein Misp01_33730 [Microtetraspora sp. NBRC 13810]
MSPGSRLSHVPGLAILTVPPFFVEGFQTEVSEALNASFAPAAAVPPPVPAGVPPPPPQAVRPKAMTVPMAVKAIADLLLISSHPFVGI